MLSRQMISSRSLSRGNVGSGEQWLSILAGLGLTLGALQRGGALRRAAMSIAGLSLLTRGAAGHCAAKAALSGQSSFSEGLSEQWRRLRAAVQTGAPTGGAEAIDSMESMYVAELQELHSAESQLCSLLDELADRVAHGALQNHLRGYATELRSRRQDLQRILSSDHVNPRAHPDQAMQALVHETRKMERVRGANVRDAALVASLQRIIHYKIAGYGTVAAYAKTLGHVEDAARFAEYADRDEAVDTELSDIAKTTLNPEAKIEPRAQYEARTH